METKLLIEQHFHGAFGIDFNKASVDDVLYLSKEILKYGIGGIFPTIVTDSIENTKRAISVIKQASKKQTPDMAKIFGIHLEGIFINSEKKGIHNPKHFLVPTVENYKLIEDDFIKIVTLAPELTEVRKTEGQEDRLINSGKWQVKSGKFDDFRLSKLDKDSSQFTVHSSPDIALLPNNLINYLNSKGIKVQAGHCTGGDLTGCSGVTHLFNAMSGITHRGESTALSALINDDIYTEIIADGVHVSDDALKLLFKTKPIDKIILISDCLPCTKSEEQRSGRQEGKLETEDERIRGLENKLFNNSSFSEILQKQKTDINHSTIQPFNPSTYNGYTSSPQILYTSVFADETIYYDGIKATSKDGTLAGSTTLLPEIIKRLAVKLEDKRVRGLEDKLVNDSSFNEIPQKLQADNSYTSGPLFIYTSIKQLITNPYRYHNIDLNGSIEWDNDWNIVKVNHK